MQTNFNEPDLIQAIAENLPTAIKSAAVQIAGAINAAVPSPDQNIAFEGDVAGAVVALGGKAITVDEGMISFGHGAQFGNITVNSRAGGDPTNVQFTLPTPLPDSPAGRSPDIFTAYLEGMRRLLNLLSIQHPRYLEALNYQVRLAENVDRAQRYGDTENTRAERAAVFEALNRLALATIQRSFNAIVGL
jgi:hypothetical protein